MDRPTDELVQRLLASVAAGAGDDAARLVDQARAEAEAEVKDLVKSAMKAVLLREAVHQLEQPGTPTTRGRAVPAAVPPAVDEADVESETPPQEAAEPTEPLASSEPSPAAEPAPPRTPEHAAATAPPPGRSTPACYVYAIARTAWGAAPPAAEGVDGRSRLRVVSAGDLQAIVSDVPRDEFTPPRLDERLQDLQWVEQKVRAHDAAVKALSAVGTVIPCRFCTILSGDDEARAALAAHRDAIVRTLDSLDGKTEWGVKLLADTRAGAASAVPPAEAEGPATDAGRSYLLQKKKSPGGRRDDVLRAASEAAEACHRELFALAADAAVLPTRDRGSPSRGWHLALNAAYLVADAEADAFHARVAALARQYRPQGLRLDLTGPWPPYNFAALNLSEARAR